MPSKTVLIMKPEGKEQTEGIFRVTGVKILSEGERHRGEVISSKTFEEIYVKTKIENG